MGEINLRESLIYLDNIVIFSKTVEEQIERLESVFRKLRENGLKLKGSKCEFFRKEIKYLGFVISEDDIKTNEEKVDAIRNWPEIYNIKGLYDFGDLHPITRNSSRTTLK